MYSILLYGYRHHACHSYGYTLTFGLCILRGRRLPNADLCFKPWAFITAEVLPDGAFAAGKQKG